jgi:biopolymer transport protein ExbD
VGLSLGNGGGNRRRQRALAEINVTPLVDVMLVLLIIFIITIRVILHQVNVDLPKATNLVTQTRPENITIAVDKQGAIYWNTKLLSGQDELLTLLRGIARQEPQPEVHIRGDSNVRYQFVGQVLVATQRIGIRKVAFITEPDQPTFTR